MTGFHPETVIKALETYGIKPRGDGQGAPGPLVHYITVRREDRGGAKEGTPELYFTDPDGLLIQLQDVSYCGGSGVLGNMCGRPGQWAVRSPASLTAHCPGHLPLIARCSLLLLERIAQPELHRAGRADDT